MSNLGPATLAVTTTDLDTAAVAQCFTDAWRYMAGQYQGHILAQDGPVAVMLSQTNCPFFNMLAIDGPTGEEAALRGAVATVRDHAERCPHGSMLMACPEWLPDGAASILADEGLAFSMRLRGMATDALAPPRRDEPVLEFRITIDGATAIDLGRVNADAYGMPHELFAVTGNLHHWSGTHVGAVGYAHGQPVCSALAYVLGERIYIAMVATLPGHHGKGYGEAAMRRAIAAAQAIAGEKRLWLHATDMGHPLYRSMGFEEGAAIDLYGVA